MNRLMRALGLKEPTSPEAKKPRLGIAMRGNDCATFTGDVEWVGSLRDRIDAREESYIRAVTTHYGIFGDDPFITHENYWIPDVVSYWVDWGDFESVSPYE